MASEKQIQAARINGAKSRGPVTALGRLNSASKSWKHGIVARTVVLDCESRDRFNTLFRSLIDELQPVTVIEEMLVQKMAVAQWRQMRLWNLEKNSIEGQKLDLEALGARTSVYETRYDRQFDRAMATLERRRALRDKIKVSEPTK